MTDDFTPSEPLPETQEPLEPERDAARPPAEPSSGIPWGLGLFLVVAIALAVFAVQNTQDVEITFLTWSGTFPLVVLIVGVVAVSVILDEILGTVLRRRRRRRRADREELKRLRAERG